MEALSKLRNRHLVSLLGHCTVTYQDHLTTTSTVFIVLENISNGSLVDHLTEQLTQDALCMDKNNRTVEVRFVFVEFDVNFASLVEGLAVADIVTGEGNTTTWKMCKKAELCQPKNKLINFKSN
ncbi:hypothetical protein CerSpe_121990 [Prunus speciosa]